MGMQPILPITVPVKKIKGAARQYYSDGDGVGQYEQSFSDSYDTVHNFSAPPPRFSSFSISMQFSGKNGQNNRLAPSDLPLWEILDPPLIAILRNETLQQK